MSNSPNFPPFGAGGGGTNFDPNDFAPVDGEVPKELGSVNVFSDLPDPSLHEKKRVMVIAPEGSWLTFSKKRAGWYRSDGTKWIFMGAKLQRVDIEDIVNDDGTNLDNNNNPIEGATFDVDEVYRYTPKDIATIAAALGTPTQGSGDVRFTLQSLGNNRLKVPVGMWFSELNTADPKPLYNGTTHPLPDWMEVQGNIAGGMTVANTSTTQRTVNLHIPACRVAIAAGLRFNAELYVNTGTVTAKILRKEIISPTDNGNADGRVTTLPTADQSILDMDSIVAVGEDAEQMTSATIGTLPTTVKHTTKQSVQPDFFADDYDALCYEYILQLVIPANRMVTITDLTLVRDYQWFLNSVETRLDDLVPKNRCESRTQKLNTTSSTRTESGVLTTPAIGDVPQVSFGYKYSNTGYYPYVYLHGRAMVTFSGLYWTHSVSVDSASSSNPTVYSRSMRKSSAGEFVCLTSMQPHPRAIEGTITITPYGGSEEGQVTVQVSIIPLDSDEFVVNFNVIGMAT